MLFPEEDASMLKTWIVKRLENTSDADADVLADYVLALLRHDGDTEDVRKLCEQEIPDFLKEDSSIFVNDVFQAIKHKSYLPGAPPVLKTAPSKASSQAFSGIPSISTAVAQPALGAPQATSRKRSWGDVDMLQAEDSQFGGKSGGGRAFKQPRRGRGRGGRPDDMHSSRGGRQQRGGIPMGGPPAGQPDIAAQGLPQFDPNNPMEAIMKMQAMGIPLPPLPGFLSNVLPGAPSQKRKQRCRDYDMKGYCARAQQCPFEHGNDSIYVPPMPMSQSEEYDPNKAFGFMNNFTPASLSPFPQSNTSMAEPRNPTPREGNQIKAPQNKQRRGRAPFSAEGPNHDRSKTTIVIENIPEEKFTEEAVRDFFIQFGEILEVSMQPYKRLAIVKYEKWGSANAAWKSPKVIFDNRFVKVFWYKEDASTLPPSAPLNSSAANGDKKRVPGSGPGSASGSAPPEEPEIDMEEFTRKQEEAQKQYQEKMKKKEEVEAQRQQLEQRQKELLAKQQEEKQRLLAKISGSAKNGSASQGVDTSDASSKPKTQTEALRAQLAALEDEAKQLGIDPEAEEAVTFWTARGGRGRGRGGYFPGARGFRGGYRGRGDTHAAYAAYSLDNRSRKVAVTGVDFTVPEKDEMLRQHLLGLGEFTDIQTNTKRTEITFKERKTAEKFFYGLSSMKIPGIDGQMEVSWVTGSTPTATATIDFANVSSTDGSGDGSVGTKRARYDEDTHMGSGGNGANDTAMPSSPNNLPGHQNASSMTQMDYDVADERDWGLE